MKTIVIAGSAKLQEHIKYWINFFQEKKYNVLDFPKPIDEKRFINLYPDIHKEFMINITNTDILFIMNEDKNGKAGYIGCETFAELAFGVTQKLVYKKDIEVIILKKPSKDVQCYEEINMWLKLGWVKLYSEVCNAAKEVI